MRIKIDLKGRRFGKLLVIKECSEKGQDGRLLWECKCDCGSETIKKGKYLLNGDTTSCGCILSKDGRTKTRRYKIWASMMTRCYNENSKAYKYYGGKGIIVCGRWHDFRNFYEDTKDGYNDNLTLDRFPDKKGNYEPGNTRWADIYQQARNKDRTKEYIFNGKKMLIPEIAKEIGLSPFTIYSRLSKGWPPQEAFKGKIKRISDLAKEYNISYDKLHHRMFNMNLSIEEAINYNRHDKNRI